MSSSLNFIDKAHLILILLQLTREPLSFPKLRMKRKVENIEDFSIDDLEVEGYKSHGKVDMKMAV